MPKILLEAEADNIEKKLIKELNVDPALVKKLMALGEPFTKACRILGYSTAPTNGGNPILAFLLQDYVKNNLLDSGLININTIKVIYRAVAQQLVADSEFFEYNNYNIIYCKNLYKKTLKEIEEYLELQKKILNPNAESYTIDVQLTNRKTFLHINNIKNTIGEEELNLVKRAKAIKNITDTNEIPEVFNTALNSIKLAEQIYLESGGVKSTAVSRNSDELDSMVKKLTSLESKYAAILLLCAEESPEEAKKALNHPKFKELQQKQIADAFIKLATDKAFSSENLNKNTANNLITKLLATLDIKNTQNTN